MSKASQGLGEVNTKMIVVNQTMREGAMADNASLQISIDKLDGKITSGGQDLLHYCYKAGAYTDNRLQLQRNQRIMIHYMKSGWQKTPRSSPGCYIPCNQI